MVDKSLWLDADMLFWGSQRPDSPGDIRNVARLGVGRAGVVGGGERSCVCCQGLWVTVGRSILRLTAPQHPLQPKSQPVFCFTCLPLVPLPPGSRLGGAKSSFLPPPRDGEVRGCRDGPAGTRRRDGHRTQVWELLLY